MTVGRVLALLVFCALPVSASAQPWAYAYAAGNYEKAADLLQQIVVKSSRDPFSAAPEPYRQLAQMYADGRGVPRDAIAACSLARMAGHATMMTAPARHSGDISAYEAAIQDSDQFIRSQCDPLTHHDQLAADASTGCLALGMPEETATMAGRSVRIGRHGISFAENNEERWELDSCPQLVAHVRTTSLAPPDDAAPGVGPRHFIEIFSWAVGTKEHQLAYVLRWNVYEVTDKRIHFFPTGHEFFTRSSWPGRGLPVEVEKGLSFDMIRSGHVRWKLDGAPPKRGWFIIGEGVSR